jgi:hypothetical protein
MSMSKRYLWGERMDLIGIENEAEFFPSGTLSDVLKEELSDITARWAGLEKSACVFHVHLNTCSMNT